MEIIHRISVASNPEIRAELMSLGIGVGAQDLVTFELSESHQSWPALERWIDKRKPLDLVRTEFSPTEISAACWLQMVPNWHHGYPQPDEDSFGYRMATYDLADFCDQCGIGLRQKASFQMKAEPKWGCYGIMQLNWIFDEYFVKPKVFDDVFCLHGINARPVINPKGVELKTVLQLAINLTVDVMTKDLSGVRCVSCGRTKYFPSVRGAFPPISQRPVAHMAKSNAYFGSGASANRAVLISQEIARTLKEKKIRGASVRPVATLPESG